MAKLIDLTGRKIGRLLVVERACNDKWGGAYWVCRCNCGNYVVVRGSRLANGTTSSCGCFGDEVRLEPKSHGMSKTRIHHTWTAMKQRCLNKKDPSYNRYGGRGIKVCDEWIDFESFYKWAIDNGYREDLTIDRIDVDGDYTPENCRWTTRKVQNNNTSRNHYITYNGETKTVSEWAETQKLNKQTLRKRLSSGWDIEKSLNEPVNSKFRNTKCKK